MKHSMNVLKYKRKTIYSINYEFLKYYNIDILISKFKNMRMKR